MKSLYLAIVLFAFVGIVNWWLGEPGDEDGPDGSRGGRGANRWR